MYVAFLNARRIAAGSLAEVLPILKRRFDHDDAELPLVFEVESGRQVEFDLRGSLDDVLARYCAPQHRGPGRPKLGVVGREVSLLPRHWEWLERQSTGSSGAIRRLVEQAILHQPGKERARRIRDALHGPLSALAGNRPHYEEGMRALYNGDLLGFEASMQRWPKDIREYALDRAREAARAESAPSGAVAIVAELHERVWNRGDCTAIERLVAPSYTIHSDPGDPWEGRTLNRAEYEGRVAYSRNAFPDLTFTCDEILASGDRVAVRWHAEGTHERALLGIPASNRRLTFSGQTFYAIEKRQVAGHWQVVDRLGFIEQLREPAC